MNREEILNTAENLINGERAKNYGSAEENFTRLGKMIGGYLGIEISPSDVAVILTMLKLARIKGNAAYIDNWVDGCGYLALGGEISTT